MEICDAQFVNAMMSEDSCFWAIKNEIRLMGGTTFGIEDCRYMVDIMRDKARYIAVMKGTQARITTAFMLRMMHAVIYGKYPQGGIYYFPKKEAVENFSKTRFGPLIANNPCIKKHLRNTNSVNIKQVGKAFLSLLGASPTCLIGSEGKKDGTAVRSTPADEVVRDERDLFDDDMADMTFDRLLNSKFKKEVDLGSPTIPDVGIHKVFSQSDQKYRLIKCQACNAYTCIAEEFPNSVKFRKEGGRFNPYLACIKCGREIHPVNGEYVAKYPSRYNPKYPMEGISGWHVSHFITPNCNLRIVMDKYEEAQKDKSKLGKFYNKFLGYPYIPLEDRLRQQDVFNCCGDEQMKTSSVQGTALAADIMKTNRVVIAEKKKKGGAKIIYMARVSGFDALYELVERFNVKSACICLRPYEESFRKFQERCACRKDQYGNPNKVIVYGAEYRDKQKNPLKTDEESGIYVVHRTEAMDGSQTWIRSGKLEIPRRCEEVNVFAEECCNTAKTLEVNEKTGDRVFRYRRVGSGADHYRHCVNYLELALKNLRDYDIRPVDQLVSVGSKDSYDPLTWGL
jgi:phage terminase large subunit GpA-like protein